MLYFIGVLLSLPSLADEGKVLRRGAKRSLQFLSNVPSLLMFLRTFSLRMERITLMMLTLLSGTLENKEEVDGML